MSVASPPTTVRVVDLLPEAASELDPEGRELAGRYALAPVAELSPGRWTAPSGGGGAPGRLGLLIIEGFMARDVHLGQTVACELVGPGDLLRPIDHDGDAAPVPFAVEWTVLTATRLAVLDRRVAIAMARWPDGMEELLRRAVKRSQSLAFHLAVCHLRRIEPRLEALMWHLADRWGRVTPEGVHIPLRLTHEMLGRLIGAQRPTVTTGLRGLSERGVLSRRSDGTWMLRGDPPAIEIGPPADPGLRVS